MPNEFLIFFLLRAVVQINVIVYIIPNVKYQAIRPPSLDLMNNNKIAQNAHDIFKNIRL